MDNYQKLTDASAFLQPFVSTLKPKVAVILGSGLGNFVKDIVTEKEIPYSDIPLWF